MNLRLFAILPAFASMPLQAATYTVAAGSFSTGDTEGWAGNSNTSTASNTADSNFASSSPVLSVNTIAGSPLGSNTRAILTFPEITLLEAGDFISLSLDIRFTSAFAADRRFQTAFYGSSTGNGYVSQMKAGTSTGSSTFFDNPAIPATGVMNAGGTSIGATGNTTHSLSSGSTGSLSIVHNAAFTLTRTIDGISLSFSATDDAGTTRTFSQTDTTSPYFSFDRFALTMWGNTVNYNLDNVVLTSSIPEPPATLLLPALAAACVLRRRRR